MSGTQLQAQLGSKFFPGCPKSGELERELQLFELGLQLFAQAYIAGLEVRSRMLELVPPGRVIFLRPLKREGTRAAWDAVWVKAEEVIREVTALLLLF